MAKKFGKFLLGMAALGGAAAAAYYYLQKKDAVASGCDRGGSTTSLLSGVCRLLI